MADHNSVRVRLAPSPTGEVHIGTIWIAMFQWLFARQHQGTFVLRIEDTDQKRLVAGSADRIFEALDWYGLTPDEGPQQGGPYGPYIQSQRLERYKKYAEQLVAENKAYYCFCTPERLDQLRKQQTAAKQPPRYDKHCATLKPADVEARRRGGEAAVIRMNLPASGSIEHQDLIRGRVTFAFHQLDDSVLLKSDGFPTYHLAVVVDDHAMKISHVIRAEEWLPSVGKHIWLYHALGWAPPIYAHLPLILGSDGSKLSKRHGAASALAFRDLGYLPEAMRNFFVLMGWHPKGENEVLSMEDMLQQFRLEDVNPSGAKFDQAKLDWLNGWYIRQFPSQELRDRLKTFWKIPSDSPGEDFETRAIELVRERMIRLGEINELINFVFRPVWDTEQKDFTGELLIPKKGTPEKVKQDLQWFTEWLKRQPSPWDPAGLKSIALAAIKDANLTNGAVLWPARVGLSLRRGSPDVFDLLALLGPEESVRRLTTIATKLEG